MTSRQPLVESRALGELTVVLDDPESVQLGDTVRRTRVERSSLGLGSLDDLSVQLGRGGLPRKRVNARA